MSPSPLLDLILNHGGPFGVGLAVGLLMWLLKHQEGISKDKIIADKDGLIMRLHERFLELHEKTLDAMNASTRVNESVDKAVTAIQAVLTSPIGRHR